MTSRTATAWNAAPQLAPQNYVSGSVYTDPAIFAAERRQIFGRLWTLVAHASEFPEPFAFRTTEQGAGPVLLLREADGSIAAYANVAAPGRVAEVRSTGTEARWAGGAGLTRLRCESKLDLVFVCWDADAPSLENFLGATLDAFAEPMAPGELEVIHFHRATLQSNWKAWMETNLDAYHTFMHVVLRKTQVDSARRIRIQPNGHAAGGGLKANYSNYKGWQDRSNDLALAGMDATDMRSGHLFPNAMVLARGTVIRLDTIIPLTPDTMILECRGLGRKGDSDAARRMRFQHHNMYWGPLSRNLPEDAFAAEACARSFDSGAGRWQIIARDENLTGQDDGMLRNFYGEWSRRLGRPAHNPVNQG